MEMVELIQKFITEDGMILVPVLWIVGRILKEIQPVKDKYIPAILLVVGVVLANLYIGVGVEPGLQGVLATGLAVFVHQLKKQAGKEY